MLEITAVEPNGNLRVDWYNRDNEYIYSECVTTQSVAEKLDSEEYEKIVMMKQSAS
jgi:hypothetical protein